jgi:hypothetical protein
VTVGTGNATNEVTVLRNSTVTATFEPSTVTATFVEKDAK